MAYPESSTVAAGNTGYATEYNNLRKDAFTKIVVIPVLDNNTLWVIKDGAGDIYFPIPSELNGLNLVNAQMSLGTASSSGLPTAQIARYRGSWSDMLTTRITCDTTELTSYTAATASAVNTSYDDVATGDLLRVDHDVIGTGTKGCNIILTFALP